MGCKLPKLYEAFYDLRSLLAHLRHEKMVTMTTGANITLSLMARKN